MPDWRTLASRVVAVLFLNAALTFQTLWPTPAVSWRGEPSAELAFLIAGLAIILPLHVAHTRARRLARVLTGVWLVLALGRYIDVTAPALWGRELNLYWDTQFLPDVARMLAGASKRAVLLGITAGIAALLLLALLAAAMRWAFGQLLAALAERRGRAVLGGMAGLALVGYALQVSGAFGVDLLGDERRVFPKPVTQVYARQAKLVVTALAGTTALPASPVLDAPLERLDGADVLLFFLESYGAVTFENPAFASQLEEPRAELAAALADTGRSVVSAFVESPTFGGSSWFAHISFLSGLRIADPDANALLMTEKRPTLVSAFAAHGYRTIAVMPGLRSSWPEGAFYGFNDIYNGERLHYEGPPFGWWDLPDQFTLAQLRQEELTRQDRAPRFVFFPTITTHMPFSPRPPYQRDWARVVTPDPFDEADLTRAYLDEPDWLNLSPAYLGSVGYAYRMLAGFLRQPSSRDSLLILIGDHQPPALVAGEGASWNVPVHIITTREDIVESLLRRGFGRGLTPPPGTLAQMHELTPLLMNTFGGAREFGGTR
ncbi:MAG: sulfatase-like hydrolase/transferase [Vicinamibacterales bacterium]